MTSKNVYQKLGHRISEEVQLLAEEKWIVEALTKIKNQRNSLQIERLHLESLKAKLKINTKKNVPEKTKTVNEDNIASTSAVNLMQHVTTVKSAIETVEKESINDASCNEEELNLMVTEPLFAQNSNNVEFNMEEDEEEESDDDMFIDMNMLMNGTSQKRTRYDGDK